MKLLEYKAHEIFRLFGLPCSEGFVVSSAGELNNIKASLNYPVVIKAQVQTGGRGKAGGVQFADNFQELAEISTAIFDMKIKNLPVKKVFITSKTDIKKEMYLSFTLDRKHKLPVMIFCPDGGIDINEIAELYPEKVVKELLHPALEIDDYYIQYAIDKSGLEDKYNKSFKDICRKLYKIFIEKDCLLAEINPLVANMEDNLLALDGKIDIDDNALFRHPDIQSFRDEMEDNLLVLDARKYNFLYIPIKNEGNIAVISNGSGMIMSSIDLISKKGLTVTSALDLGGGATADRINEALKIIASNPRVNTIFINIFGGITRCDEIARGVESAMDKLGKTHLVLRLEGTNKDKGLEILHKIQGSIRMAEGLTHAVGILSGELN